MNLKKYLFLLPLFFLVFFVAKKYMVFSGEFTSTSATLNNARLSFASVLDGAQTAGSSLITIDTTSFPSRSVLQLQNRDNITINNNPYVVATTIDDATDNTLNLTAGIDVGDIADQNEVYGKQISSMTIRLTTISALNAGSFRILVPAADNTAGSHDDAPDAGGFDTAAAPSTIASITCPTTASYGTWTPTVTPAETSTIVVDGVYYHSFVCAYSGLGAVGTVFDGTSEPAFVLNDLINPAPKDGAHTLGQADTYSVIIQHLDNGGTVVDQVLTKIGVIDAVKVSASIAPQITFTIAGTANGQSRCGNTTDVTTTALTVPFGALTIGSFVDASQRLTVTTNALNGYAVTAAEDDQVGREANVCTGDGAAILTCIVDASVTGATHTTAADWTDGATYPGFGYSLATGTGSPTLAFTYNTGGTFMAKQFADMEDSEPVQTIFSRTTVAASDAVDVCYRISPAATNAAGNYENYLVYTASATF